ncbi:MAG: DOPA 4,5-dioxygenase family protein [Paracoccaceae bacterium]
MTDIQSYHAHVYFDADTVDQARAVCEAARDQFDVEMGRVHEKPLGPHPMWSCQLAFGPEVFDTLMPWLALNRGGLIVFTHPNTGDALKDHRDHAIWMGTGLELNLDIFD